MTHWLKLRGEIEPEFYRKVLAKEIFLFDFVESFLKKSKSIVEITHFGHIFSPWWKNCVSLTGLPRSLFNNLIRSCRTVPLSPYSVRERGVLWCKVRTKACLQRNVKTKCNTKFLRLGIYNTSSSVCSNTKQTEEVEF